MKFTFRTRTVLLILVLAAAIAAVIAALSIPYLREAAPSASPYVPPEENKLVVYTSHKEEVWWPVIKEFEERTGIYVEVVEGGTNELLETLSSSKDEPVCDVMFGGGAESLNFYRDLFLPYQAQDAEHLSGQYSLSDHTWTPFSALPVVLIYNPKLVAQGQLTSWQDLLDPQYKGRIAFADPAVSASNFTALATMLCACGREEDQEEILKAFAHNLGGLLMASSGDSLSEVADGTCLVGISLEETALKRIDAGDNLAVVYPGDGTSAVPDGTAILLNAPHPENAKRFLDYTISEDVQHLMAGRFYRHSVRDDIEEGDLLPELSQIPMVNYDMEEIGRRRESIMTEFSFFFGGEVQE